MKTNVKDKSAKSSRLFGTEGNEVFSSADDMVMALDHLIHYLNRKYTKTKPGRAGNVIGFIVERLNVTFTNVKEIEIQTDYAKSLITILAPTIPKETERAKQERRINILKDFLPTLKESQIRATVQLYKTLRTEAREELFNSKNHSVKEKKAKAHEQS